MSFLWARRDGADKKHKKKSHRHFFISIKVFVCGIFIYSFYFSRTNVVKKQIGNLFL